MMCYSMMCLPHRGKFGTAKVRKVGCAEKKIADHGDSEATDGTSIRFFSRERPIDRMVPGGSTRLAPNIGVYVCVAARNAGWNKNHSPHCGGLGFWSNDRLID